MQIWIGNRILILIGIMIQIPIWIWQCDPDQNLDRQWIWNLDNRIQILIDNLDSDLDQNGNMISKDIIRDREISHRSSVYLLVNFSQMSGLIPLPTINLDRINGCRRVHRIFLRRERGRERGEVSDFGVR